MQIILHPDQPGQPIEPFWRVCVCGGRVAEALRADFQKHLELAQREMPFQYIRMHGLFHEDMMIYREQNGQPILNWQYVDLVYDHWLSIGIRPFAELSFMPYDLASGSETVAWWRGNITPPRDWNRWEWLVGQFIQHVIERYSAEEVRRWYFEVWNEPNLDAFWLHADFDAYMKLYACTSQAIKSIDPALRVGGPATTGSCDHPGVAPWGKEFLAACAQRGLPLDFFSTHPYPTLHPVDLDGSHFMVWDAPGRLRVDALGYAALLQESAYPAAQRHYTEWSSSPSSRDLVHDTAFLAPFIVLNNLETLGLIDSLGFWTISDICEEQRLGDTPFHGGFGLITTQGLKKPGYHGYWFLSRLGSELLAKGDSFVATRRADGTLVILLWNYCHYHEGANDKTLQASHPLQIYDVFSIQPVRQFVLTLQGVEQTTRIQTTRFDRDHGSVYDAWAAMGAPAHILPADLEVLRARMELEVQVSRAVPDSGSLQLNLTVQPFGVTLLEIKPQSRKGMPMHDTDQAIQSRPAVTTKPITQYKSSQS